MYMHETMFETGNYIEERYNQCYCLSISFDLIDIEVIRGWKKQEVTPMKMKLQVSIFIFVLIFGQVSMKLICNDVACKLCTSTFPVKNNCLSYLPKYCQHFDGPCEYKVDKNGAKSCEETFCIPS